MLRIKQSSWLLICQVCMQFKEACCKIKNTMISTHNSARNDWEVITHVVELVYQMYTLTHFPKRIHAHTDLEHLMSCGLEEGSENSVHLLWQEVNRSHIQACWRQSEPQEHLPAARMHAHTHAHTRARTYTHLTMKHTCRCHDKHSFKSYTLPIHRCKITHFKYHHTLCTA